jgi:hypothetical protein
MSARRRQWVPTLLALASLAAACRGAVPASLELTVASGPDAPAAARLRVRVFDPYGVAHQDAQFAAPAPAADGSMGTVVIYPRAVDALSLRVQVQGLVDGAVVCEGNVAVVLASGKQLAARLILRGPSRAPDSDGDGVADQIDNCPAFPNPNQADSDGDGLADDCHPPARDAADGAPLDGGAPDGELAHPPGAACRQATECASGHCLGGVCCESACTEVCRACNLPGLEGRCALVASGQPDPQQRCRTDAPESCGQDGTCNGAGACRLQRAGTVCGLGSCSSSVDRVLPALCDGKGTCLPAQTQPCAPYRCANAACSATCSGPQDCAGGACVNGSCGRKPLGAPCTSSADCNSQSCVDGVCCDIADCSGPCRACNLPGAEGSCRNLAANAEPRAAGCAMETASSCGRTGKCDGAGACQLYSAGTVCTPRTCTASLETGTATCNGSGACAAGPTRSCGVYACNGDACATSCTADAQCAAGYFCGGRNICRVREADGAACAEGRECLSGLCVLGRCCATATCQ